MKAELKDKKILVIVESPNKCEHIKDYLQKAGYNVRVCASKGHIAEIRNGGSYYNTGIEPSKEFEMDLAVSADKKETVASLKKQVAWADLVVLGSDGDNEGAQISWSLMHFLKLPKSKVQRFITHEITPKAVVQALENPVPLDTNNAMASQARMCLDKIIGWRLSPISRNALGAKSVGRCQSVGLKLVSDRENEIKNFKPEVYFDIYLNFKKNKTDFKAKYIGTDANPIEHLKTQEEVDKAKSSCNSDYIVKSIEKREKPENPKPPFSTATFQQEAASKLGLKVKDAMSIAQKLFENGAISYHRTDDTDMSPEFIDILKPYIESNFGKDKYNAPRKGKKTGDEQAGHECLRITDPAMTPEKFNATNTNNLHQKVYRMIWQRTIASCLPCALISETTYNIYNNDQKFNLISKEVIDDGYRTVYNYKDDDQGDDILVKETFKEGEVLKDTELNDEKKETQPPHRYSEATLIKTLKSNGCGRPSTYATIVETVLSTTRGYAELNDKKQIVPTDKGLQLSAFLDKNFSNVINLTYTRDMEKDLDKIADGKMTKLEFLTNFYNNLENTIKNNKELANSNPMSQVGQEYDKVCPNCGKKLIKRYSKKNGKFFLACPGFPKCKHAEPLPSNSSK